MKIPDNSYNVAKIWVAFSLIILVSCLLFYQRSTYMEIDALGIWILSSIAILYISRYETGKFSQQKQKIIIYIGILMLFLSLISIPLGITKTPTSIGELLLILSSVGVILFGLYNFKSLVLPVSIPFIAVVGFGAYELFIRNQDWITAPIIPYVVLITIDLLNLLGIQAVSSGNVISFMSQAGVPIYLSIVSDCTGIWSLGTFTVSVIIVLSSFPKSISKKSGLLIVIGYIGTFCANIARILLISLSGYFFGPVGIMEQVHIYIGWICFTIWLIIFWYYYFTRQIGISTSKKRASKTNAE